jgi:signal peptidase
MRLRRPLSGVATAALMIVVAALVLGQLLGQPVLLGYVTTGSMEPALSQGDGFVAVPSALAGSPQPGDVVVFESETVQGGGLTTHRVVEVTDEGYVTKGDANPFTNQDGGEPPVSDGQIAAHALQVNGQVVAIPHLGTAVTGVRDVVAAPFAALGEEQAGTVLVFVGMLLFVAAGAMGDRRQTSRSRDRENVIAVWAVVLFAAAVVTMAATAAMVVPASTYEIELVATDEPSDDPQVVEPGATLARRLVVEAHYSNDDPQVVEPGATAEVSYEVHNGGVIPALVVTDPVDEGVTVEPVRSILGFDERERCSSPPAPPRRSGSTTPSASTGPTPSPSTASTRAP